VPRKAPVLNTKQQSRNGCRRNEFRDRDSADEPSSDRHIGSYCQCAVAARNPKYMGWCMTVMEFMEHIKCRQQYEVSQSVDRSLLQTEHYERNGKDWKDMCIALSDVSGTSY
jgi:hypothetical protein